MAAYAGNLIAQAAIKPAAIKPTAQAAIDGRNKVGLKMNLHESKLGEV